MAERMRTCVGCRRTAPARDLVRVSRGADGSLAVGPSPGRGAWLCGPPTTVACLDLAVRRTALARALRTTVGGDEVVRFREKLDHMSG